MITVAHETLGRLAGSRRIYIAEIRHALGGGLEIALPAIFVLRSRRILSDSEVTLACFRQRRPRRYVGAVGASKAMGTYDLGTRLRPEQALQLGVVNPSSRSSTNAPPQYPGFIPDIVFAARHIRPTAMESKSISD